MNQNTTFVYENRFGSVTFAYNSGFWITEISGISSVEVDIAESQSVNQIGSSNTNQSVRPRAFTVDGCIYEPLGINRERLIYIIAPQVPATLTVNDGGKSWYLDVVPELTPDITPGNGVQHFQLRLKAAYPYWRTSSSYATQLTGLTKMFKFPFYTGGTWRLSKYSEDFFKPIQNIGNVPIEIKATFTARSEIVNPEIYHIGTEKKIKLIKKMVAGEKITVSTVYSEIGVIAVDADGNATNGFKYLSIDSDLTFSLVPGENIIRSDAESNRNGLSVRLIAPEGVKSGV